MSISQFLQDATSWLAWSGIGLTIITLIAFITRWGIKFRLVGATIFTILLSGSFWAFQESYTPPREIEGALYVPVVYDNGADLVVAQASEDFPEEAIQPSLEQIAENLKGGGRNVKNVYVRIRRIEDVEEGISKPVVLGQIIRDPSKKINSPVSPDEIVKMNEFSLSDPLKEFKENESNYEESSDDIFALEETTDDSQKEVNPQKESDLI